MEASRTYRSTYRIASCHNATGVRFFAKVLSRFSSIELDGFEPAGTTAGSDDFFKLGPDSLKQEGVPHGEVRGPFTLPSKVFEGTQHTYWFTSQLNMIAISPVR